MKPAYRTALRAIYVALALDAALVLGRWAPSFFGHVGSEEYEWNTLRISVVGVCLAGVLVIAVPFVRLFGRESDQK